MVPPSAAHTHETRITIPPGWLLAIDTSTDRAGVALYDGDSLHDCTWSAARAQTTQVLPCIRRQMKTAGIGAGDLAGIAVATGPGTFTGLRVGLGLAKGFGLGLRIPVFGISTLAAIAWPWQQAAVPVIAVIPAGRGRLVWQQFDPDDQGGDGRGMPVNGAPAELLAQAGDAGVQAIVGELPASPGGMLGEAPVPVVTAPGLTSRIGAVAVLGLARYRRGEHDDLATLEPVYVHGTSQASRPVRDARP